MTHLSRREVSRLVGLGLGAGVLGNASFVRAASAAPVLPLDHIVWAVPDLDEGVKIIADLTGIEPVSGGIAPGRTQTHNALISLGGGTYFEILSPSRAGIGGPWEKLIQDGKPHIVSYALRSRDHFAALQAAITAQGFAFEGPRAMGRVRPDGGAVNWELLTASGTPIDDALPFFIDWLDSSPHPSESSPKGASIDSFVVAHPRPAELSALFRKLGVGTPVIGSDRYSINLVFNTPRGKVWLS